MTIDERLEKLTERHEALAQSVELLLAHGHDTDRRLDAMAQTVESVAKSVAAVSGDVSKLFTIVTIQNERIKRLEDNPN